MGPPIGYWIPYEAVKGRYITYLSSVEIGQELARLKARKILVVADSCFSGTFLRGSEPELNAADLEAAQRKETIVKEQRKKTRLLLSSGAKEPVLDGGGSGHSVFARAFLTGLEEMPEQAFWVGELYNKYIKERVSGNAPQSPQLLNMSGHEGGDVILYRVQSN